MKMKRGYRFNVVAFPVGVNIVSEPPSFSKCHARARITRPYVFHHARFVNELAGEGSMTQQTGGKKNSIAPPAHLERLEKMLARRIPLSTIHHRMGRKVREPVMRFMFVVEQDLRVVGRVFSKEVPEAHSAGGCSFRDDGWLHG
jgi:hypothetical protein